MATYSNESRSGFDWILSFHINNWITGCGCLQGLGARITGARESCVMRCWSTWTCPTANDTLVLAFVTESLKSAHRDVKDMSSPMLVRFESMSAADKQSNFAYKYWLFVDSLFALLFWLLSSLLFWLSSSMSSEYGLNINANLFKGKKVFWLEIEFSSEIIWWWQARAFQHSTYLIHGAKYSRNLR